MSEYVIEAKIRGGHGKKYAKNLRSVGRLPGVVYGPAFKPKPVEIEAGATELLYRDTLGKNALLKMKLDDGGKISEQTVMFKDVLRDPVKSNILHVDFYHVDAAHPLKLEVPVVLDGESAGQKEGGILEHGIRYLQVKCLPDKIPSAIHVDISKLGVGENILVQDLTPPEGVKFLTDAHAVLAHVAEIKEEVVAATETAAAPAGEAAKEGDAKAAEAKSDEKKGEKK